MTSPPRPPHPSSVDIIYGSSISDVGEEEEDGRKCPSKLPNHLPFPSLHFFPTYLLPLGSALQCSYASRVVDFSPKSKHFGVKTVNLAARIPENNRRRGINVAWQTISCDLSCQMSIHTLYCSLVLAERACARVNIKKKREREKERSALWSQLKRFFVFLFLIFAVPLCKTSFRAVGRR